jgi:poly-gamma-glutamate synthase PgsB/CapB
MRTLLPCLALFLAYLVWERIALDRARRRIPLLIAVTGTRGKSTVARLLASILKEDGRRVMAKTTGSQAMILLPDGGRIELDRSVTPSILEQKQLVHKAARLRADCLIAEVMSIRPENHYIECHHILRPNLVAITNVRRDHTESMGETEDQIASVLSLDIYEHSRVFLPAKEDRVPFQAVAQRCGATLIPVEARSSEPILQSEPELGRLEFADNFDLVYAIAVHLGIRRQHIIEGIRRAQHDIGRLRVWRYRHADPERAVYLVNAFAANDPESTFQVLAKVMDLLPAAAGNVVGILNLRADRLPRTVQWISVLRDGALQQFRRLFVVGDHSRVVQRRLPGVCAIKAGSPEQITKIVCAEAPAPAIIFGFGNVKGSGQLLAEYWDRIGRPWEQAATE